MKLSLCVIYIYLVTSINMHLHEHSFIIAFRSSKNNPYWFLIIWLQSIFILFLSTIFKIFFADDSDYLPSMPEWSWFHCIFLSHRITNLSSLYKVIISRFLGLSVWEYISLSIANLSWMPTNLFPPHLQPFFAFTTGLMIFRQNHWMTIGIKWSCANRFCPSAWQFVL